MKDYAKYTDKYFIRSKQVLYHEGVNPYVRYQVFARQNIKKLKGIKEAISFIRENNRSSNRNGKVYIYALRDRNNYIANTPIMKLEGYIQDLIELETVYLSILSKNLTGKVNMKKIESNIKDIVEAAEGKELFYFGARHFNYGLDKEISKLCYKYGFSGCSTDNGAKAWGEKAEGVGTIPHSLVLTYGILKKTHNYDYNATSYAAKQFDRVIDSKVPRIALVDTFNKEFKDTLETCKDVNKLSGIRVDTCRENTIPVRFKTIEFLAKNMQHNKYITGFGVTISSIWDLRRLLDENKFGKVKITLSSGFNANKIRAFVEADKLYVKQFGKPLFDSIGTGSIYNEAVITTSDIVAYRQNSSWIPYSKVGRREIASNDLKEVR